jgi:hypothetical protein
VALARNSIFGASLNAEVPSREAAAVIAMYLILPTSKIFCHLSFVIHPLSFVDKIFSFYQ